MERARFARIALYAVAALGVFAAVLALLIVLKWQPAVTLGNWAVSLFLAKWRGAWIPITVCCAVIMELFFLNWEKTTMFRVFARRGSSAVTDLGSPKLFAREMDCGLRPQFWLGIRSGATH